jgi:trimethylamine:corrinoid methyltransferase-like protein
MPAFPALPGADELSELGEMEAGVMGSYAQMVADNEFAGSIIRMRMGIPADTDALAVEEIAALMEGLHNFLRQSASFMNSRFHPWTMPKEGNWIN